MKLSYYCDSCKQENIYITNASDRVELQMRLGKDEIKEQCKFCKQINTKHINRLMAIPNKLLMIISGIIGLIIPLYIIFRVTWLGGFLLPLPILLIAQIKKTTSSFNKTMIRRK